MVKRLRWQYSPVYMVLYRRQLSTLETAHYEIDKLMSAYSYRASAIYVESRDSKKKNPAGKWRIDAVSMWTVVSVRRLLRKVGS